MLRGIGTSKGIGIGHALVLKNVECEVRQYEIKDTEAKSIHRMELRLKVMCQRGLEENCKKEV